MPRLQLWRNATQTVFGEGSAHAHLMLVGEQPGNDEDLTGHPFVGPAGRLLQDALEAAGITRDRTYVTNVVKHFKWESRGKRRIHLKPRASEIAACRPWLDAEIDVVRPQLIACLGATAARAFLGPAFKVSIDRGKWFGNLMATVHPAAILRERDTNARRETMRAFVNDLKKVKAKLQSRT